MYLYVTKTGQLVVPEHKVDRRRAAFLVYSAGVAIAALDDFIGGLPQGWANSIGETADAFRARFLDK